MENLDRDVILRQKKKWTVVNICSYIIGFTSIVLSWVFRFVSEAYKVNFWVCLGVFITFAVIDLVALVLLVVSWYKLRRYNKMISD